jgi:hypothetical protein
MADLLANLEVSLTQNGGASERLRVLLSKIDAYMSIQRQQDAPSRTIDQQRALMPTSSTIQEAQRPQQINWPIESLANFNLSELGNMAALEDDFSFQLPQELLTDWPWPFDLTQGLGNY